MGFSSIKGGRSPKAESLADELRLSAKQGQALIEKSGDSEDAAYWLKESERQINPSPLSENIKGVFENADAAMSAIKNLRKTQYDLVSAAADINDPVQTARFQTEYNNISTEITRIASAAVFNSQNTISGVSLTANDSNPDIAQLPASSSRSGIGTQKGYALGDFSGVASSISTVLTVRSSAQSAVDTLDDAAQAARNASDSAKSRLNKAASAIESANPSDSRYFRSPEIRSSEDAEAAIKDIVREIRDAAAKPDATAKVLFNNLDPDRVRDLLA